VSVIIHNPAKTINCAEPGWREWIASPDLQPNESTPEWALVQRRGELRIHAEIADDEASYSFDDFALVSLDDKFYLLNTTGCSCPSPSEQWGIEIGPASLLEIRAFIEGGHYSGYTVPKKQLTEFLEAIDSVKEPDDGR